MNLCVTTKLANKLPFDDMVKLAAGAGFQEFDFGFTCPMTMANDWQKEMERRAQVIDDAGMKVKYAHLPYDYPSMDASEEEWERFETASKRAVDAALMLGAECAAIHPRCSINENNYDPDEEYARAYRFLTPYCEYAHQKGLPLGIENMRGKGKSAPARFHRFGMDVREIIRLADELDEGVCWDTGHGNISMQDECKSIVKIGARLRLIHVNDNYAEDDIHIAPFLGNVDWAGVIEGLKKVGYRGSMNLEVTCKRTVPQLYAQYTGYIADSGRELIRRFTEE